MDTEGWQKSPNSDGSLMWNCENICGNLHLSENKYQTVGGGSESSLDWKAKNPSNGLEDGVTKAPMYKGMIKNMENV